MFAFRLGVGKIAQLPHVRMSARAPAIASISNAYARQVGLGLIAPSVRVLLDAPGMVFAVRNLPCRDSHSSFPAKCIAALLSISRTSVWSMSEPCPSVNASCYCEAGYTGLDCAVPTCPNECSGHGRCRDWTCQCDLGFTGSDCSLRSCPLGCKENERVSHPDAASALPSART